MKFRIVLDHTQADIPEQLRKIMDNEPAAIEFEAESREAAMQTFTELAPELNATWRLEEVAEAVK